MNTSYALLQQRADNNQSLATALNEYRVIEVSGPDTIKFLQGQLTCDLKQLAIKGHLHGSHCNIKGHMVGVYHLFYRNDQQLWLRVHKDIAQVAFDTLKKYSIFSKVELSFIDSLSGIALDATSLESLKTSLKFGAFETSDISISDQGVLARYDDQLFEVWIEDTYLHAALSSSELCASNQDQWLLANIERGLPDLRATTQEHFIPQMTNMQAIGGVSFNKGCYTGQEIVTRLQHRGILKKAMYRFSSTASAPAAGDSIVDANGKAVAEVVIAANTAAGSKFLAVIQQAAVVAEAELKLPSGEPVQIEGLPYELDQRMFESKR